MLSKTNFINSDCRFEHNILTTKESKTHQAVIIKKKKKKKKLK